MIPERIATTQTILPQPPSLGSKERVNSTDQPLWDAARALETSFVAEMLKSTGVGKSRDSFGGGAGEQGFASFLVTAQAEKIVQAGGFGLAERIFASLVKGQENHG